jgi:hypothetical protein
MGYVSEHNDEPFAVVIVKDQDWRLLEPLLKENYSERVRVNADADRFPNRRNRRVALLVRDGHIVGLSLARYQSRSADVDHMIALDHLHRFDPPLRTPHFVSRMQNEFRKAMAEIFRLGGLLSPKQTADVVAVLSGDALHLADLEALRDLLRVLPRIESAVALRRAEQRDALAVVLEVAGLDSRQTLPPPAGDDDDPRPFMHGLKSRPLREAALIRHDADTLPGWLLDPVASERFDCAVFVDPQNKKDRISVTYADKERLEEVTGTDLIYFRTYQPGYVLVQYKRMTPTPAGDEVYRPDASLYEEIRRMRTIMPSSSSWLHAPSDYRLSPEPFFMKLVDSQVTRREAHKLAVGMYFPLALFESMLESDEHRGPRGGRVIRKRSAPKHLSNDLFIHLLKGGWIGTAGNGTEEMSKMINLLLDEGRGVLIAEDHRDPDDGWGSQQRSRDWDFF